MMLHVTPVLSPLRILLVLAIVALPRAAFPQDARGPDPTDVATALFEQQVEDLGSFFQFIDVHDMRAIRAQIGAAEQAARQCHAGPCPNFDCGAAAASLRDLGELHMRLDVFASALDHWHGRNLELLTAFHNEALFAEEDATDFANAAFWQASVLRISALTIQVSLLGGDLQAIRDLGTEGLLTRIHLADEAVRDFIAVLQDMNSFFALNGQSGLLGQVVDGGSLGATVDRVTGIKSDLVNLRDSLQAAEDLADLRDLPAGDPALRQARRAVATNFVALIGREFRNVALAEVARRQAEVDDLRRQARRERAEAELFVDRVVALRVQAEMARAMADGTFAVFTMLDRCVQANCPAVTLDIPDVPLILRPADPRDPVQRPRIDQTVLKDTVGRISRIGLGLSYDWVAPVCLPDTPPPPRFSSVPVDDARPPLPNQFTLSEEARRTHGCSNLLPELRDSCFAAFENVLASLDAMRVTGERGATLAPMSPAMNEWSQDMCRVACRSRHSIDVALDTFRALAVRHVALIDLEGASGRTLEDLLAEDPTLADMYDALQDRRARAARNGEDVFYLPGADINQAVASGSAPPGAAAIYLASVIGSPLPEDAAAIDALWQAIAARLAEAAATPGPAPPGPWAAQALDFWSRYGPHQLMTCGGTDLLRERRRACEFHCETGPFPDHRYDSCMVPPLEWTLDAAERLYPPGDPRRDTVIDLRVSIAPMPPR